MSWESSIEYERIINRAVREELGGTASADLILRSFNFSDVEAIQERGDWVAAGEMLALAARDLERAGAEAIVLCTNTMHVVSAAIENAVDVPFLHIADATGESIRAAGLDTVALLGTRYTMEKDFYAGRLRDRYGLTILIPDEPDRTTIHDVIYEELVRGVINPDSRAAYRVATELLVARGAQGVIAGCTEIELLVTAADLSVPFFPTAELHARAAARFALSG